MPSFSRTFPDAIFKYNILYNATLYAQRLTGYEGWDREALVLKVAGFCIIVVAGLLQSETGASAMLRRR